VPAPDTSTAIGIGASTRATIAAVRKITVARSRCCLTPSKYGNFQVLTAEQMTATLSFILVAFVITGALAHGLRTNRGGKSILKRPYNNRYNDATGARDDRLG
jgi:hypothetical protein